MTEASQEHKHPTGKQLKREFQSLWAQLRQTIRIALPFLTKKSALFFGTLAVLATFGTLVSFVLILNPRLSVSPLESLDPNRPFLTPFQLSNDGLFSIHDVSTSLQIVSVKGDSASESITEYSFSDTLVMTTIPPGDKATFFCMFPVRMQSRPIAGEVYILVKYRPDWWPFHQKRWFYFIAKRDSENKLLWLQFPNNNPGQTGPEYKGKVWKGKYP